MADPAPEPEGYRTADYSAPVPATLTGATVLDAEAAYALWKTGGAVFVDVLPQPPKPANLPAGTLWREKPRDGIPGSIWLPDVGYGALSAETEGYFRDNLDKATQGDKAAAVAFYCRSNCWMSWNAAKRAMEYGYERVFWFPEGMDGWTMEDRPTERLMRKPRP